jgi:hypothetical protein
VALSDDAHISVDAEYDEVPPRAEALIHSLRAFGYDLTTALADLIDNSIAAGAKNVRLDFHWNGPKSYISVSDDGKGMAEVELLDAMRPGNRSPLEKRNPRDLGRYGLGLKTASFSQAKRLTVGSKQAGSYAVRCWDLDFVTKVQGWRLLRQSSATFGKVADERLSPLKHGTVVMWENMDRVTPRGTDVQSARDHDLFLIRAERVRDHLAMVFHRFLDPRENPGKTPLRIWVNGQPVEPWDPFLSGERATQLLTDEAVELFGDRLTVRPYVLPHHSKISAEKHRLAAGAKGWNAQQGFYVYRNRRLLAAGTWLGLGFQQEEHYKLARILLDIPNHMDAEWEIDVKKSRATPPPAIRDALRRIATATRSRAAHVYRHRGARLSIPGTELTFVWEQKVRRSKLFYQVNRSHPLVSAAVAAGGSTVRALLSLIEETVPIHTITKDWAEDPTRQAAPFEDAVASEIRSALYETYCCLIDGGVPPANAVLQLLNMEPFNQFPDMVAALDKEGPPRERR